MVFFIPAGGKGLICGAALAFPHGRKGWDSFFLAKYILAINMEAIHRDVAIYEPIRTEIESEIELPI